MNCLASILKDSIANTVWKLHLNCFCYTIGILQCYFVLQFICCICWIISILSEDYFLKLVFEINAFHVISTISRIEQILNSMRVYIQEVVTTFDQWLQILPLYLIHSLWSWIDIWFLNKSREQQEQQVHIQCTWTISFIIKPVQNHYFPWIQGK